MTATTFQTDARRRATLPGIVPPNETFEVEQRADGTFLLVPLALIPKHQLWAWKPAVRDAVEKASRERSITLDSPKGRDFLAKLEAE